MDQSDYKIDRPIQGDDVAVESIAVLTSSLLLKTKNVLMKLQTFSTV